MIRFLPALLAFVLLPASAQPVYKCNFDGKTSYADHPCEHGAVSRLPPAPAGVDPSAGSVHTGDARTLLELEKLRAEREKRELAMAREERLSSRSAAVRRNRCERLRLHATWAEEDVTRLHGKSQERARLRARRQRESLAAECPG